MALLDPNVPAPQLFAPQPVDDTYSSRPTLIWYAPSTPDPPLPVSLPFAVAVAIKV